MKPLFLSVAILFNLSSFAASISLSPFEMRLDIQKGFTLAGEVELACRYEKFVFGDSAQYETFYQKPVPLDIKVESGLGSDFNRVLITNKKELYFEYDELFKFGEECRASFKVHFFSKDYSLGHTIHPEKPVTFTLWKGFYDYQEGDQVYDLEKMRRYLHNTTYSFPIDRRPKDFFLIRILQDGKEASTSPWVQKAYKDPMTGRPRKP